MTNQNKPPQNQNGNQYTQNPSQKQPQKQDDTRKHAPNQGPDPKAPARDRTDGARNHEQKIQTPQK